MEDVAATIFRLVIIGFVLLGVVRRDKRKRMTGKDSGSDNGPERPTEIPWEQLPRPNAAPQPAPTAKRAVPAPAPAAEQPCRPKPLRKAAMAEYQPADTAAADPVDAEAMAAEYYKKRQPYTPVSHTATRPHATDTTSAEAAEDVEGCENSEKSENGGILSRFDLRDAVLYSEILKPKFDEQA